MIGCTVMDISREEMIAIVQFYLNSNLLNVTFQKHHKSVVRHVHQRSSGRFAIEFLSEAEANQNPVNDAAPVAQEAGVGG